MSIFSNIKNYVIVSIKKEQSDELSLNKLSGGVDIEVVAVAVAVACTLKCCLRMT